MSKDITPNTVQDQPLPDTMVWEQISNRPTSVSDLNVTDGATLATAKAANLSTLGSLAYSSVVSTLELADAAVTQAKIAVDAIQGSVIAAGAITNTKIGDNSISTGKLQAASITGAKIAAGTITASNIQAGTITATEINTSTITTLNLTAGSITGLTITGGTIQTSTSGQRVIVNGSSNEIEFYNSGGTYVGAMYGGTSYLFMTGNSAVSLAVGANNYFAADGSLGANISFRTLRPSSSLSYDLGSSSYRWGTVYASGANFSGSVTISGTLSATISGYAQLSASQTFSGVNYFTNTGGTYVNFLRATGSSPQLGSTSNRFVLKGSTVYYTALVNDSDRNLKKDITSSTRGLTDLMKLSPVSFKYKDHDPIDATHYGFIAQDIQSVIPEIVTKDKEGTLGLSMVEIIPIIVKAVQELAAKVGA